MARQFYSFWAVNGNDLDELHLGHVSLLLELAGMLRGQDTELTIVLNLREMFGSKNGLSDRGIRAYRRFFDLYFASTARGDKRDRVSTVDAPTLLGGQRDGVLSRSVREAFTKVIAILQGLDARNATIRDSLRSAWPSRKASIDRLAEALEPFATADSEKRVKLFEQMAIENTVIIASLGRRRTYATTIVAGKRHEYKYALSNAIVRFLGGRLPLYKFIPNVPSVFRKGYMRARGGAPPILITATQDEIIGALVKSQKHTGADFMVAVLDRVLKYTGGIPIGKRKVRCSRDLAAGDIEREELPAIIAERLYGALEPFRRARQLAIEEARGEYMEFTGARCVETLGVELCADHGPVPERVGEEPLKFRDRYMALQDAALELAGKEPPLMSRSQAAAKARTLAAQCYDIDVLSYFTSKRYRDHHIHVVNVMYAGRVLLSLKLVDGVSLKEHVARALNWGGSLDWEAAVDAAWTFAALLHDHCYPVGFALANADRLRALSSHFGAAAKAVVEAVNSAVLGMLGSEMRNIVKAILTGGGATVEREGLWALIQGLFAEEMAEAGLEHLCEDVIFDHGVLSAVNLLDYASVDKHREGSLCAGGVLRESAKAILLHNLPDCRVKARAEPRKVPIEFHSNPLGAILVLCDEMQEWGRTCLGPQGYETMISRMLLGPIGNGCLDQEFMRCVFEYTHLEEKAFYEWNFDRFSQGKARNLGRISFAGIPFPRRFDFAVGINGMSIPLCS